MPFLAPAHVTWHSAFIVTADGEARAIVGLYDKKTIEDTGAYSERRGLRRGRQGSRCSTASAAAIGPSSIAVNYSEDSEVCDGLTHGMYLTLRRAGSTEIGFERSPGVVRAA